MRTVLIKTGGAFAILALATVAAPALADDDMPNVQPAAQADILAGATACLGASLDPDPKPARFTGWAPVAPDPKKNPDPDGKLVTRGNVMIAYKPGKDGGCVVLAATDASYDAATFYPQLTTIVGATVAPAASPAPIDLPDGEILVPVIAPKTDKPGPNVILVFANKAGKFAKKGN